MFLEELAQKLEDEELPDYDNLVNFFDLLLKIDKRNQAKEKAVANLSEVDCG